MSDRELAREWVERAWKGPKIASCEDAYLAGLEHGRLTWTGTPPAEAGHFWYRSSPTERPCILEVGETSNGLWVLGWIPSFASIKKLHPACQWSSAPIPHPGSRRE